MPALRRLGPALLTPLLLVAACAAPDTAPPAPPPPEVAVVRVAPSTADLGLEAPARIEGSREVEVRTRVQGIVLERRYREGAHVRAGELLFVIDPAEYQAATKAAEARLAEARARVEQAQREQLRLEPLVSSRATSQKSLDDATSALDLARAGALAAEAALDRARLDLGWTRVTAPIAGMAGRAVPSEGALVEPGDNGLLTRIIRTDPAWVRFSLASEDLLRIRGVRGELGLDQLEVAVLGADGAELGTGRLDFIDVAVDPNTGTVALRAEVANPDGKLVPGDFVRVRLLGLERPDAILVPQRAVQQGRDGRYVFVLEGDVAALRPVEVGPWVGADWLIESGLEAGEQVIVDGVQKVRPGSPVRVAAEPSAASAAAVSATEPAR